MKSSTGIFAELAGNSDLKGGIGLGKVIAWQMRHKVVEHGIVSVHAIGQSRVYDPIRADERCSGSGPKSICEDLIGQRAAVAAVIRPAAVHDYFRRKGVDLDRRQDQWSVEQRDLALDAIEQSARASSK